MRNVIIFFMSVLLFVPIGVMAQNGLGKTSPEPTPDPKLVFAQKDKTKQENVVSELTIVGKKEGNEPQYFEFKMGESLKIKATGEYAERIKTEFNKDAASKMLKLYFNGVPMTGLTSAALQKQNEKELYVEFYLERNASNDDNRRAWDTLLKKHDGYTMIVEPALAVGNDLPVLVQSAQPVKFYVAKATAIVLTLVIGLAILVVVLYLIVTRTNMLRDESTGYYSLGKSQMTFWGLLVLLAFAGVWILTFTMERISPQVLILLGISGATGLGAIVIGNSKRSEIQNKIIAREKEEQDLKDKHKAKASEAGEERLKAIEEEKGTLYKQLGPGKSRGFWLDICDDGNGISFGRLQVVIWTMVLGAIFVQSVAKIISMPEFSETLLTLMGISNGTYLGFKIPEKEKP